MAEIIAETERLRLRQWTDADEENFYEVMNTPEVMRWLGGVQTRQDWHAGYERIVGYQRDFGFTFWIVEDKAGGDSLGFCGLKRANAPGAEAFFGEVEIGWRLRQSAWGQGIAKEAAIASMDLAFGRFEAPRVVAVTATDNLPSQALMLRLGMARRKEWDFIDGRFPPDSPVNPQVTFVIESADWPAARQKALQPR